MDKKFTNVLISLVVVLALFAVVMFVLGAGEPAEGALFNFSVDQASVVSRFVFVVIGIGIALGFVFLSAKNILVTCQSVHYIVTVKGRIPVPGNGTGHPQSG